MKDKQVECARHNPLILIVDNDKSSLSLLSNTLKSNGYYVRAAHDGEEAVKSIIKALPSLILLDAKMPDIGGIGVCRTVSAMPEMQGVPIIVMTTPADTKGKLAALEDGAVDYVTKPILPEEVIARVGTHLELAAYRKNISGSIVDSYTEMKVANRQPRDEIEARRRVCEELVPSGREVQTISEHSADNLAHYDLQYGQLYDQQRVLIAAVDNSPDSIARYDRECRRIYVNGTMRSIFGQTSEQMLGYTPMDGSKIAQPEEYQRLIRKVLETGEEISAELSYFDDEIEHYVYIRFAPELGPNGDVMSVFAVGRDISALKEAEKRLEESHAQLQALTKRRETARHEERKRLAREIHDDLGQYLTALSLHIAALQIELGDKDTTLREMIGQIGTLIEDMKQSVRNLSKRLRPEALDMGLRAAAKLLVDDIMSQCGIHCTMEMHERADGIGEACSVVIYRVIQESLTNIVRYAEASHVSISLEWSNDGFVLKIKDDGKGFDLSEVDPTSYGLIGMRERLQAVGGELDIDSKPLRGTSIVALVPAL